LFEGDLASLNAQVVEEFIKDVKDGKIKAHTFTPQEEENVEQSETQTEKGEAQAEQKTGEGETLETGETPTTETPTTETPE